jgi:hypothetical protein
MAAITGLSYAPTKGGAGTSTVDIQASANTGRVAKTSTLTVKTTLGSPAVSKTVTVTQAAIAEFLAFSAGSFAASNIGSSIELTGTGNAEGFYFEIGDWIYDTTSNDDPVGDANPGFNVTAVTVNGSSYYSETAAAIASNATAISGDPGATATYKWSSTLVVPANTVSTARHLTIKIICKSHSNVYAECTITQTAAAPTLTVSATSVSLPADGTFRSISVTSNTNWAIS